MINNGGGVFMLWALVRLLNCWCLKKTLQDII